MTAPGPEGSDGRPRSSSLALIDTIADTALEPGYVRSARHRAERAEPPARGGRWRAVPHAGLLTVLIVVGFLLVLAAVDVRRDAPAAAQERATLADRVEERAVATDALGSEVQELRRQVALARDRELAATREGRERTAELRALELGTGAAAVEGPGVTVTVDDAPSRPDTGDGPDLGRVQDRDLQLVVNGLWAAGAEAVAVNGHRLTARSAIRTAGQTVLVDFRPVTPPYRIDAVGDPATLRARFVDGPGGRALSTLASTYGIRFGSESVARMRLPAAASLGDAAGSRTGGAQ